MIMTLAKARHWLPRVSSAMRARISPACLVCDLNAGDPATAVCADCERDCFADDSGRCDVCAIRLPSATMSTTCGACLRHPPHFDATIALGDYTAPVDGMVVALKAGGRLALAATFGALLAQRAQRMPALSGALVLPVPLAFERHSERGFNQALEIARRFVRVAQLDFALEPDALLRVRHGAAQHVLAPDERRRNVRGAFAVRGDVDKRHAIVVDDVMTTGATLDEIARLLKKAGAARVSNFVVARTPSP